MSLGGFVHFYIWNRRIVCRKSCCRFLPSATHEQVPAARLPSTHCHTACRNAGMPSANVGGDRQMTSLTQHGQQFPTSGWVSGRYRYFLLLRKVAAPARLPTGRGAPEHSHRQVDAD